MEDYLKSLGLRRYRDYDFFANTSSVTYHRTGYLPFQMTLRSISILDIFYIEFGVVIKKMEFISQNGQRPYSIQGYFTHDISKSNT